MRLTAAIGLMILSGCTSVGPSSRAIENASAQSSVAGIQILELDNDVVRASLKESAESGFKSVFGDVPPVGMVVGRGDSLEVSIWEAPPATLFGGIFDGKVTGASRPTQLPVFLVGPDGTISVPFAGNIEVVGRTLPEIERLITDGLRGKAHKPQVIVRLVGNATATVTVVGEVGNSVRVPLTPKGERLLDIVAAAGGTRQPVEKMMIQISRGGLVHAMPLQKIIRDPSENIRLLTDDLITAIYQPFSFTVLGAAGRNEEIKFEATGITLAQAMGRVGGLQDGRANPKGVFLFRWEDARLFGDRQEALSAAQNGQIPVIYKVDMKDPGTYFAMQNFAVSDRDVIYVATSSAAEVQRFANIVASTILPITSLERSLTRN